MNADGLAERGGRGGAGRSAPGLLLAAWALLVGAVILVRHVRPPLVPAASPSEFEPAYLRGSDWQTLLIGLVGALVLGAAWLANRRGPAVRPVATLPGELRWWPLIGVVSAGVGALAVLMLLRPLPTVTDCPASRIVHLNASMGFVWNCDSSLFQQVAGNPLRLFDEQHPRQSRPLYALIGFVLVQTVGRVAGWMGLGQWEGEDTRAFIALVALNLLVLVAAATLLVRLLLGLGTPVAVTVALTVALALNGVTAEWTLTPHQQVFAVLVPVVTVLVARQALVDPPGWRTALWWGLAVGLAANVYGSWLITVPVVGLALLLRLRRAAVRSVGAFVGGTAVPVLAWMALCRLVTGSYYSHEASVYRQFVWVLDAAQAGPGELARRSASYLLLTLGEILATSELWLVGAALAVGVVAAAVARVDLRPDTPVQRATLIAVGLTAATTVAFLWGVGFFTPRLSVTLLPLLLIVTGWVYARLAAGAGVWLRRAITAGAVLATLAWVNTTLALV